MHPGPLSPRPHAPHTSSPTSPRRLGLSRVEAAEVLSVSVRTIDNLIADKASGFPIRRIGRKVVIPWLALERWLDQQVDQTPGTQTPDSTPHWDSRLSHTKD